MRQLLYVSSSTIPGDRADLAGILEQSRHNNALDGITGLLWSDGACFLQVVEGPEDSVARTLERILADPRHHDIAILSDRPVEAREFGGWTMAHRRRLDPADVHDAWMRRLLSHASAPLKARFADLIRTGERPVE